MGMCRSGSVEDILQRNCPVQVYKGSPILLAMKKIKIKKPKLALKGVKKLGVKKPGLGKKAY